ncbi:hypothetical protein BA062_37785 [Prauserella flavalba]|uniref:Uncharacterized protein n=2 Tax=Prauserella flavalba TaxID=1477506 RepID=A0A318LBY5_9PSEU|nr:hypothetical protein BA062_37785 [Prauserella flavalba]
MCKSCRARILWATTRDGERMPVNADPASNGNVLLALQDGQLAAAVLTAGQARMSRARRIPLRLAHFATCPKADHHRRRAR